MLVGLPFQVEHLRSTELDLRRLGIDFARLRRVDSGLGLKLTCSLFQLVKHVHCATRTARQSKNMYFLGKYTWWTKLQQRISATRLTVQCTPYIHILRAHYHTMQRDALGGNKKRKTEVWVEISTGQYTYIGTDEVLTVFFSVCAIFSAASHFPSVASATFSAFFVSDDMASCR